MTGSARRWWSWPGWVGVMAAVTLGLLPLRPRLDKAHVALIYLLVVLAGSVRGGRRRGLFLAAVAFVLFNWFFLRPYNTLAVEDPLDLLVLAVFFVVSAVAAELVHRVQAEAEEARRRTVEVDRFAALGAETINVARADDALVAVASVIRTTLDVDSCLIHLRDGVDSEKADPLVTWVLEHGYGASRDGDRVTRLAESGALVPAELSEARTIFFPLLVRERTVGVLELSHSRPIVLDVAARRFLTALAYYAALGAERARLAAEAGRADALREADRLKDALLASVSHDLRTPLTTIKALAHDLAAGDERAVVIEEEADRLNRLVANLLDLSRLQGGALALSIELTPVDDLVGAAVQRVRGILGARELKVELEDGGTLLVGRFDFAQTLRIVVNLIENAVKFSPPNAPVELAARRAGARVELSVSDHGPGLAAPEQERVFQPFYRALGLPPDTGRLGLGLAIARRLAEVQDGALHYEPREGGGSRFVLTLPAADLSQAHPELL